MGAKIKSVALADVKKRRDRPSRCVDGAIAAWRASQYVRLAVQGGKADEDEAPPIRDSGRACFHQRKGNGKDPRPRTGSHPSKRFQGHTGWDMGKDAIEEAVVSDTEVKDCGGYWESRPDFYQSLPAKPVHRPSRCLPIHRLLSQVVTFILFVTGCGGVRVRNRAFL